MVKKRPSAKGKTNAHIEFCFTLMPRFAIDRSRPEADGLRWNPFGNS
jgi:hypothetical protein